MIYGDNFNAIFDAIERIEAHVGLNYYNDDVTVNGRLNNLEYLKEKVSSIPYCEIDIPISGDTFETSFDPILLGDAWVVNNSAMITTEQGNSDKKVLHEWGDIEFTGNIGTLMGANGAYDGDVVTVTYFYSQTMLYYDIVFINGYPSTNKSGSSILDLVVNDESSSVNQRIHIDSKGRVSSYPTSDATTGNELYEDTDTGDIYEIFADNGTMNWRII